MTASDSTPKFVPDDRVPELANLVLVDDDGRPARVGDAWKDRAAILTFLRHYG